MGFRAELKAVIRDLCSLISNLPSKLKKETIDSIYTPGFRKLSYLLAVARDSVNLTASHSNRIIQEIWQYCREHPVKVTFIVICAVIILCVRAETTLVVLKAVGFGVIGPIAGSLAAKAQAAFGVNPIFSALQSAAMGGYVAPAVSLAVSAAIVAAAGALVSIGSEIWSLIKSLVF